VQGHRVDYGKKGEDTRDLKRVGTRRRKRTICKISHPRKDGKREEEGWRKKKSLKEGGKSSKTCLNHHIKKKKRHAFCHCRQKYAENHGLRGKSSIGGEFWVKIITKGGVFTFANSWYSFGILSKGEKCAGWEFRWDSKKNPLILNSDVRAKSKGGEKTD